MDIKAILGSACTEELAARLTAEIEKEYKPAADFKAAEDSARKREMGVYTASETSPRQRRQSRTCGGDQETAAAFGNGNILRR